MSSLLNSGSGERTYSDRDSIDEASVAKSSSSARCGDRYRTSEGQGDRSALPLASAPGKFIRESASGRDNSMLVNCSPMIRVFS